MSLLSRPNIFRSDSVSSLESARWALQDLSSVHLAELDVEVDADMDVGIDSNDTLLTESEIRKASLKAEEDALLEEQARQIETETRLKASYDTGYETGYEEGRLEGEIAEGVRLRNAIAAAERALDEIRDNEVQWHATLRPNLVALSVAIARYIIGRELKTDADAIADLVRKALAEFPIDQPLRIRVNPHDLSLISACDPAQGEPPKIAPNRDIRWLADPRIEPGGCLVEGREQIVDGRVDTALERVYRRITYSNA